MSSLLPQSDGWLPYWLLFTSVLALGNSLQAYLSLGPTRQVYAGRHTSPKPPSGVPPQTLKPQAAAAAAAAPAVNPEVSPLQARTFGTWTAVSAVIRLYAAYNLHDARMYQLALWTYAIAGWHFYSEWLVFGSARWGRGLAGPIVVATGTLGWMVAQWSWYVS